MIGPWWWIRKRKVGELPEYDDYVVFLRERVSSVLGRVVEYSPNNHPRAVRHKRVSEFYELFEQYTWGFDEVVHALNLGKPVVRVAWEGRSHIIVERGAKEQDDRIVKVNEHFQIETWQPENKDLISYDWKYYDPLEPIFKPPTSQRDLNCFVRLSIPRGEK